MKKKTARKFALNSAFTNVHPNVIKVLGALRYRQGEGQNMLAYAQEVASLAGLIAVELGADESSPSAPDCCTPWGRGLDHTFEGSSAQAGAEFLKKNGEKDEIVHAVRAHSEDSKLSPPSRTLCKVPFRWPGPVPARVGPISTPLSSACLILRAWPIHLMEWLAPTRFNPVKISA